MYHIHIYSVHMNVIYIYKIYYQTLATNHHKKLYSPTHIIRAQIYYTPTPCLQLLTTTVVNSDNNNHHNFKSIHIYIYIL